VCRQLSLRQPPLGVPVILVSALAEESSVVTGLDSGADDYITKPFRRAEFLARIRGKLNISSAGAAGELVSEQRGRQIWRQGKCVRGLGEVQWIADG
jgi:DNA-binding response OmpR family regulator